MRFLYGLIIFLLFITGCSNPDRQGIGIDSPLTEFLWIGIPQPILLTTTKDGEQYEIQVEGGDEVATIVRKSATEFTVLPHDKTISGLALEIYRVSGSQLEFIQKKEFKTKFLPNLMTSLCKFHSKSISKNEILNCGKIQVNSLNFDVDLSFPIVSFDLITFDQNGMPVKKGSNSAELNQSQIDQIQRATVGSRVIFEKVIVHDPGGNEREASPLILEIK